MYVIFLDSPVPPLTVTASVAIWNRDRTIIVIAAGTWGINVIFLIQGKHRPLFSGGSDIPI
jgi:hypothetical protein